MTIASTFQSYLGCSGDWQPDCPKGRLSYDANDDVWQESFILLGDWEYKAALNGSWDENYGLHAVENGDNIALAQPSSGIVKFYYDHKTHWVTDNVNSTIVTAAGSFQSELGCLGDWQPDCLRSWLEDPDGDGTFSFVTEIIPAGAYEAKAAIDEAWDENYGAGGVADGANIPFTVPVGGGRVIFSYVAATHILTITVTALDKTAPTISGSASPPPNGLGWNRSDVVVTFSCTDTGSGVDSLTAPVTLTAESTNGSATGTCTDEAGNSATTTVGGIKIDKTAPIIAFSGNAGTYTLDQHVAITCVAQDPLSGLASAACQGIDVPAGSLAVGSHTLTRAAQDRAGNTANASTTFSVIGTGTGLCKLTEQLVRASAKYRGGGKVQRAIGDGLTTAACGALRAQTLAPRPARAVLIAIYKTNVSLLAAGGWLTPAQAELLRSHANSLP